MGATGVLRALRASDGTLLWRRDLEQDFPGSRPGRGHAASPLLAEGCLVVPVGAPGAAVVGLDPADGSTRWSRHDFGADYASPLLVRVEGAPQLVCHMEAEVIGLEPRTGELLWRTDSPSERTRHVLAPVELGSGNVLVSTTYGVERLALNPGAVESVWSSRRIAAQIGNLLFLPGEALILGASSAHTGSPLVALDAATGATLWRERGIDCGFLWSVGASVLALDSDGFLVHARATRGGLSVFARHRVLDGSKVWSAPAMHGTTLFLKDAERIVALELGV